ncbi:MAG: TolC family protein [Gammaproteobacteria bacterium]
MSGLFPLKPGRLIVIIILVAVGQSAAQAADNSSNNPLSLAEAEQLALSNDPLLTRFGALASAYQERAVADAQLPDPQLSLGLQDIPIDSFSLTDDEFTELGIGVQQTFPAGDTLKHRGNQATAMAGAEQARMAEEERRALREVRNSWLEVYYQTGAVKLLRQNQKLFSQLVEITQSQYGAGFVTQQDVLGAGLELSLLKDRETDIETARAAALAELAKWVGAEQANRPLADEWDAAPLPERTQIEVGLDSHPLMQVEDALVRAGQSGVDLARDQYKPAFGVELGYGLRGGGRTDYLSGMLTLDLPIFTGKRQDRRLAASQQEVFAARYSRDDRRRELRQMLDAQYASWTRLGERLTRNEKQLLPQATQNAESALNAYQSGITNFPTLVRARITELETHLSLLRLRIDQAKAHANLLYLAGENR